MNKTVLLTLVTTLVTDFGGGLILLTGREGSGKSDLATALLEAAPDNVGVVYLSEALATHLNELEGGKKKPGSELAGWIKDARAKMKVRSKDIHPYLVTTALYKAVRRAVGSAPSGSAPKKVVLVDGYPRMPKGQAEKETATNIFGEFFPNQPAMLVEADCDPATALDRALKRGKPTDTRENIIRAHGEYDQVMPTIISQSRDWADHLVVKADTTAEEKRENFARVLQMHLSRIAEGNFKGPGLELCTAAA